MLGYIDLCSHHHLEILEGSFLQYSVSSISLFQLASVALELCQIPLHYDR